MEGRTSACGGGPHEARRGLRCHGGGLMRRGRRIGGGARKKRERAAVFDEEEEEGIDLRQALALIYQGDLFPVPDTSRDKKTFTPGACYQPGVKVYLYSRLVTRTGSKGFFGGPRNCNPPLLPGGLPTRE